MAHWIGRPLPDGTQVLVPTTPRGKGTCLRADRRPKAIYPSRNAAVRACSRGSEPYRCRAGHWHVGRKADA